MPTPVQGTTRPASSPGHPCRGPDIPCGAQSKDAGSCAPGRRRPMTTQAPLLPLAGRRGDRSPAGLPHRARLVLVRCDHQPTRAQRRQRGQGRSPDPADHVSPCSPRGTGSSWRCHAEMDDDLSSPGARNPEGHLTGQSAHTLPLARRLSLPCSTHVTVQPWATRPASGRRIATGACALSASALPARAVAGSGRRRTIVVDVPSDLRGPRPGQTLSQANEPKGGLSCTVDRR